MIELMLTLGGIAALFLGVDLVVYRLARANVRDRVHCDERGADFDVMVAHRLTSEWDVGRATDIVRCSAFSDSAVTCDKACLRVLPQAQATA